MARSGAAPLPDRLLRVSSQAATLSKTDCCCRMSAKSAGAIDSHSFGLPGIRCNTTASRLKLGSGRGFHSMASQTLKLAVVAPIPRARVAMAVSVKPGDLRSVRAP